MARLGVSSGAANTKLDGVLKVHYAAGSSLVYLLGATAVMV